MKKQTVLVLTAVIAFFPFQASAVWEMILEDYVASFHASAALCKDMMPAEVAIGLKQGNARIEAKARIDLSEFQKSEKYIKALQEQTDRLKALSAEDLVSACEWNWKKFTTKAATDQTGAVQSLKNSPSAQETK